MVLCLPIDVIVGVVLSVVVCPRVVFYEGTRASGIGVTGWDWTVAILLTEAVGVGAGVTAMSPGVAVPAVAVLGAGVLKLTEEDSDGGPPVLYELPVEYINYCWYSLNLSRFQGTVARSERVCWLGPQVERSVISKSCDRKRLLLMGCLQSPLFSLGNGNATLIYNGYVTLKS